MCIGGEGKQEAEVSCAVDARKKGLLVVLSANTMEEINIAISALQEIAQEE